MPLTPRNGQVSINPRTDRIRAKVGELPEHVRDLGHDEVLAFVAYQGEENAERIDVAIEEVRALRKDMQKGFSDADRLAQARHEHTLTAIGKLAGEVARGRERDAELERRVKAALAADRRLEQKVGAVREEAIAEARKSRPDDQLVAPLLKVVELHTERERVYVDRARIEQEQRTAQEEWKLALSKARWRTFLLGAKLALKWLFGLGGAALLVGTLARSCGVEPVQPEAEPSARPADRHRAR